MFSAFTITVLFVIWACFVFYDVFIFLMDSSFQVLVDCSGNEGEEKTPDTAFLNKKAALIKIMENPVSRTIIFCNKVSS